MKAATKMKVLVNTTADTLGRLGFKFERNGGEQLVEFNVLWPEPFMVRISHLAEVEYPSGVFGMILPSRQSECTDLRLVFAEDSRLARQRAAELVKGLLETLPKPPWKGLGLIEAGTARAMWRRAADGRE